MRATELLHTGRRGGRPCARPAVGRRVARPRAWLAGVAGVVLVAVGVGCVPPPPGPPPAPGSTYQVVVAGETFVLRATAPAVIAQLDDALATNRTGVLGGELRRGDGGFNAPHLWHVDPASVFVADLAIEVCDGRPTSDLDADPDYWIDTVGSYCPWAARVVARL